MNLSTRYPRVLVAEDMEMSRQLVRLLLTSRGFIVDEAENGLQALELSEHGHYDLIFMDCLMPVMDGYEATRRLREREAATGCQRTPVIAFTGCTLGSDLELCNTAGMDDYLIKPFTPEVLVAAVARWIAMPSAPAPRP